MVNKTKSKRKRKPKTKKRKYKPRKKKKKGSGIKSYLSGVATTPALAAGYYYNNPRQLYPHYRFVKDFLPTLPMGLLI